MEPGQQARRADEDELMGQRGDVRVRRVGRMEDKVVEDGGKGAVAHSEMKPDDNYRQR